MCISLNEHFPQSFLEPKYPISSKHHFDHVIVRHRFSWDSHNPNNKTIQCVQLSIQHILFLRCNQFLYFVFVICKI